MTTHCGYIAIIGRPNVGKSTLLNALLSKKLSITSRKPQTTRHRILGIKTRGDFQLIFVDTPGIHEATQKSFNQYLNRTALSTLREVDIILWVIEASQWTPQDTQLVTTLKKISPPILVAINKVDLTTDKETVLSRISAMTEQLPQAECIPLSAKKAFNLDKLEKIIQQKLPENPFFFDPETITDRPVSFVCSEFIREKLVRLLGKELPYTTAVIIQSIEQKETQKTKIPILHINAVIWVEKEGQKKIVIGDKGKMLKMIGERARLSMEKYFGQKVFLSLWVKVKTNWTGNERILRDVLS